MGSVADGCQTTSWISTAMLMFVVVYDEVDGVDEVGEVEEM